MSGRHGLNNNPIREFPIRFTENEKRKTDLRVKEYIFNANFSKGTAFRLQGLISKTLVKQALKMYSFPV